MRGLIPALWRFGTGASVPALRWMLRRRVASGKEIAERLGEREGFDTGCRPPGRLLWLHAASVGESVSMLPVLSSLAEADPAAHVLFTTGTVTSARLLQQRLPQLGLSRVQHRFVPLDVPEWASRFLDHWQPNAAAFVESELWPNLLGGCQARGIKLLLLNARMSRRSYGRWRRVPGLARQMIGAFDVVHPQSNDTADRLRHLGARRMVPAGNLKLAAPRLPVDDGELEALHGAIGDRPVWLAANTHPGEEALAASVHRALSAAHPGLLTIIAPRHPGRGAEIAAALGGAPRRGLGEGPGPGGLWIADTLGEMGLLYRLAPVVFVGKSLIGHGGQNPLEAARFGCAIATGPHTGNFEAVMAQLRAADSVAEVGDEAALTKWVGAMLGDAARRDAMGQAARSVAEGDAALPGRIAALLLEAMPL